eukprot:4626031-Alexandrium_andersonii.AAC.1
MHRLEQLGVLHRSCCDSMVSSGWHAPKPLPGQGPQRMGGTCRALRVGAGRHVASQAHEHVGSVGATRAES